MRKIFGVILTPIHYIFFGLSLLIFHPLQWMAYNWFGYTAHKRVVDALNWCLTASYYCLGNTVTFVNQQNLPLDRSILFIANHQSTYDIPPMIYFLRKYHAKFVSKIELATKGIPSVSYNLKYGGAANIDRNNPRQSVTELMKLGERMQSNKWSCVIFPEGTRSKDGQIKHFADAGIGAILRRCPDALLVPIAINNSWKMKRWGSFPLCPFIAMRWEVLEPIDPKSGTAAEVVLKAEEAVKKCLGQAV